MLHKLLSDLLPLLAGILILKFHILKMAEDSEDTLGGGWVGYIWVSHLELWGCLFYKLNSATVKLIGF